MRLRIALRVHSKGMPTAYDQVLYRGLPFAQTIPTGWPHGYSFRFGPGDVARCRVLELGCGDGGNLIPMAVELPGSESSGLTWRNRASTRGWRWLPRSG